jgi:signal transduction histidine kinase
MIELDRRFGTSHYLVDAHGIDAVSGKSLAGLLPAVPDDHSRGFFRGRFIVTRKSGDGRYWLVSVGRRKEQSLPFGPYALVAIGMALALSLAAAFGIILPIRRLTQAVRRFGRGELAIRTAFHRRDEIGTLSRAFNEMADRIARLITGERRLLQDISHELRSPLARLKLAITLARTAADREGALDRVERDVDRITALTADLVEMARMEGEARALEPEWIDLGDLLREAAEDCNIARTAAIHWQLRQEGEIVCDRELLRRAVENILRNAIRYSPPEAPIDIATINRAGTVVISIRDRGTGVPENELEQIFTPFYRVDEARDTRNGGLGLGLAIARNAVLRQGGAITAHNANPGLRIDVTLPA